MKLVVTLLLAALPAFAQTKPLASEVPIANAATNETIAVQQHLEELRASCIQNRRIICGKILKVQPDGLVVDSGYTDLMRPKLSESWLIPGTVTTTRPANQVEANRPDAVCIGLVFVTDLPKSRGVKPRLYDYVNLEGFPVGQCTYTSVGNVRRTVRKFTPKLQKATQWRFDQNQAQSTAPK